MAYFGGGVESGGKREVEKRRRKNAKRDFLGDRKSVEVGSKGFGGKKESGGRISRVKRGRVEEKCKRKG